jgi:hypothetical protein
MVSMQRESVVDETRAEMSPIASNSGDDFAAARRASRRCEREKKTRKSVRLERGAIVAACGPPQS